MFLVEPGLEFWQDMPKYDYYIRYYDEKGNFQEATIKGVDKQDAEYNFKKDHKNCTVVYVD